MTDQTIEIKPNAVRAYAVLDHIDADPDSWIQRNWIIRRPDCGTAGCFAGWTCMLAGDKPVFDEAFSSVASYVGTEDGERYVADRAAKLLGFADEGSMNEAAWADEVDEFDWNLFDACNTRADLGRIVEKLFGPRPTSEVAL